jgi:hypothetical protein
MKPAAFGRLFLGVRTYISRAGRPKGFPGPGPIRSHQSADDADCIIPALDEVEDGHLRLGLGLGAAAVQQLAFPE